MDTLHLVTLAIVQGIAEFLPISSSAHLVLVPKLLGWPDQGLVFDLALHFGTLGACLWYFRADIGHMFGGLLSLARGRYRDANARLLINLAVATIPVGVAGLMLKDIIEHQMRDAILIAFTSIWFGVLLWYADVLARRQPDTIHNVNDITLGTAFLWGIYQAIALIPGVSRSGISVIGGRALGATRETAGKFGTLMSIPVTALVVLVSFGDVTTDLNWHTAFTTLALGTAVSFVFALAGIHLLVTWCAKVGYVPFMIYRILLGCMLLALFAF